MEFRVFQTINDALLEPVTTMMDQAISNLSSAVASPLATASIIYIAFFGYQVMRGQSSTPIMEYVITCIRILIIYTLATKAGEFNYWIKNIFFEDLPTQITKMMASTTVEVNVFDQMILKCWKQLANSLSDASIWNGSIMLVLFSGIIMLLCVVLLTVIAFIVTLFAKIGLAIVLSLGPLFIGLALFQATRRFTEAWIGQVANFIILQVLVVSVGTLMINLCVKIIENTASMDIFAALPQLLVVGLCGCYLFLNLPGIAAALASGGAYLDFSTRPITSAGGHLTGRMNRNRQSSGEAQSDGNGGQRAGPLFNGRK